MIYDIIRMKKINDIKDIKRVYKKMENTPYRWRIQSFVIEKFLFDKIVEIGKDYKIDISFFSPILKILLQ